MYFFLIFIVFTHVPECSGMFRDVPECSGMFRNVPECSGMFRDVPGCSEMFHVPAFIDGLKKMMILHFYHNEFNYCVMGNPSDN